MILYFSSCAMTERKAETATAGAAGDAKDSAPQVADVPTLVVSDMFDSFNDFQRLLYDATAHELAWQTVESGQSLVGSITTMQEVVPCVEVDVQLLDDKRRVVARYTSSARHTYEAELVSRHTGACWAVAYDRGTLAYVDCVPEPDAAARLGETGVPESLIVRDDAHMRRSAPPALLGALLPAKH